MKTVYEYAFYQTTARYELTNVVAFIQSNAYGDPLYCLMGTPTGRGLMGCLSLAEGMTSIELNDCPNLTDIRVPSTVRSINARSCDGLTKVELPAGVQSVYFYRCGGLEGMDIPEGVHTLERHAFFGCDSMTYVTLPAGMTEIPDNAFMGCGSLVSVVIPEGVTRIGNSAFSGCSGLTGLTIPESVTYIGDSALHGCVSLTELLGHDYTSRVTRPTCLHEGYTTHTCGRCGDSYRDSVTEPLGHNPGPEACCDRDQTCTVCSALLAERLGHDYATKVIDPTCDSLGYTDHTCSRCGHNYTDNEIPAFGHTPDGEADCERDQTCTVCGQVLAESTGHDYTEVYTPPTCTEGGYTTYTCGRCGESHRDGLMDPRGHSSGDWIVDTEPAPGVMGSKHMECTVCGVILDTKELESLPVETVAEPVTEAPTEEPAETLTSAPAESMSPAESATKPQSPDGSGGCSGTVGAGVLILLLWSGLATLLLPRRGKEER